jgi:hypothetical protein
MMAQCQQCGNEYDKTFQVVMGGQNYVFDSFECAIAKLAPNMGSLGCERERRLPRFNILFLRKILVLLCIPGPKVTSFSTVLFAFRWATSF